MFKLLIITAVVNTITGGASVVQNIESFSTYEECEEAQKQIQQLQGQLTNDVVSIKTVMLF